VGDLSRRLVIGRVFRRAASASGPADSLGGEAEAINLETDILPSAKEDALMRGGCGDSRAGESRQPIPRLVVESETAVVESTGDSDEFRVTPRCSRRNWSAA
jgi:hypothetical protein